MAIKSKPATAASLEGWTNTFGPKDKLVDEQLVPEFECPLCDEAGPHTHKEER